MASPGNEDLKKVFNKKTDLYAGIYRIFFKLMILKKSNYFLLICYILRGSERMALWFYTQS